MEAKATVEGVDHLNKHLHSLMPDRTLGGIKGKRRGESYKVQVASMIASLQDQLASQHARTESERVSGDQGSQRDELIEEIRKSVAQLGRIHNKYARALQELGEAALRGEHMDEAVLTYAIKSMFDAARCPRGPTHSKVAQYHGGRN